ncbi:MAG: hypothetical protein ACLFSU_03275 [Acholeplasmataceae bacterium]
MKNKDIIERLKREADRIDVPDIARTIVERAERMPKTSPVHPVHRRTWRPVLRMAFILLFVLSVAILLQTIPRPGEPVLKEETLALSSVMSASLANDVFADRVVLQNEDQGQHLIDRELEGLGDYFHLMEQVFASDSSFDVTDAGDTSSYQKRMRFRSRNFLDERTDYDLYYDRIETSRDRIVLDGLLVTPDGDYPVSVQVERDEDGPSLLYRIGLGDGFAIESALIETADERRYEVDFLAADETRERFVLNIEKNGRPRVFLQFLSGPHRGAYRFTFDRTPGDSFPALAVNYAVIAGERSETGRLDIRLKRSMETDSWVYDYRIRPRSKPAYRYERARSWNRMSGNTNKNAAEGV